MEGKSTTFNDKAQPLGQYCHVKRVGDFIYIAGTSSRRPDNTHEGVEISSDGTVLKDIRIQTKAVLRNIDDLLKGIGSHIGDVVDITTFLVDMNDFEGYNEEYAKFFGENPPTRTTVAVYQLPHPNLLIEIKAIAYLGE